MNLDNRLVTGIFIGMILGLHYGGILMGYLPILTVITVILALKIIHH